MQEWYKFNEAGVKYLHKGELEKAETMYDAEFSDCCIFDLYELKYTFTIRFRSCLALEKEKDAALAADASPCLAIRFGPQKCIVNDFIVLTPDYLLTK